MAIATPSSQFSPQLKFSKQDRRQILESLERKVLWFSSWIVHHANHVRPKKDRLKVGGHQASSASVTTLMTALYFDVLRPEDRVAVKPHASPAFHAIQYLLGRQSRSNLERFRALGGAQAYPSRTKDADEVDISTGSVGMGVAMTVFTSLVQDYLHCKSLITPEHRRGRMVAVVGDAELDEGNVFEALFEGWKQDLRDVWWVIDYNRQSLDLVVEDQLVDRVRQLFRVVDWRVLVLKYGKRLQAAFAQRGGDALKDWIDSCPNSLYSALVYQGGAAWRTKLKHDLGDAAGIAALLDEHDDSSLHALMTNLAGHDMDTVLDAFHGIEDQQPTAVVAYTIKGYGLPLAGHKDNHAGLMSPQQFDVFRRSMSIPEGEEWEPFAGLAIPPEKIEAFIGSTPFMASDFREFQAPQIPVEHQELLPVSEEMSTQNAFGRLLNELARGDDPLSQRIVTVSPDVASSTNLGPWITKRGVFRRKDRRNFFAEEHISSNLPWTIGPSGQHFEFGIAETNLFLQLGAAGLAANHHGERLFPIGTLYDPFIRRGLDAMNYACYQDARFIVVGTPSGVTLAPEGGAHQSIVTPLIGTGHPNLSYFEPAFADELQEILLWSFSHLQASDGGSVYLRLSTRKLTQPQREMTPELRHDILEGGYWLVPPSRDSETVIVAMGALVPEAVAAQAELADIGPPPGLLVITSPSRLARQWISPGSSPDAATASHVRALLSRVNPTAELVTILDGHPLTLAWLGAVLGTRVTPLGVHKFGASGSLAEVYGMHHIDAASIINAARHGVHSTSAV
jgi:pyruvate dehydrogenase E1 component